jgi:deoxyribodipyrimidine photolyase
VYCGCVSHNARSYSHLQGVRVFDQWLLDADWALNNANWQWLSCSRFFHQVLTVVLFAGSFSSITALLRCAAQFFRVYSPVAFGKKTDPNGDYIRHWVPQLVRALPVPRIAAHLCDRLLCSLLPTSRRSSPRSTSTAPGRRR